MMSYEISSGQGVAVLENKIAASCNTVGSCKRQYKGAPLYSPMPKSRNLTKWTCLSSRIECRVVDNIWLIFRKNRSLIFKGDE